MEIKDLHAKQGNVDLTAEVVDKGNVRTFEKFGKQGKVCNAKINDGTGTITLTLWNDDVDKIDVGDKIKITNGYISEWQGELQLGTGKFGKLEISEKGTGKKPEVFTNAPQKEDSSEDLEDSDEDVEEEFFD